jgi:hypothetical protein
VTTPREREKGIPREALNAEAKFEKCEEEDAE